MIMSAKKDKNKDSTVTKGILNEALLDMTDTILKRMTDLFGKQNVVLAEHTKRLDKIESDVCFIKQDVRDIKAHISCTFPLIFVHFCSFSLVSAPLQAFLGKPC